MKDRALLLRSLLLLFLPAGCVEPYYPPNDSGLGGHLVVSGFINASKRSAVVNLSRSIRISEYIPIPAETNATVTITNSAGAEYKLTETKGGMYEAANLSLDATALYKLHVSTQSGESFSSENVELLPAPVLDSISWEPRATGVQWYVTGHSFENNTRYYKWSFDETFEYNVQYWSDYKKVNQLPVFRTPDEWVYTCYASYPSTNVLVGSSKQHVQDVMSLFPINFVPKGSIKLSHHYRMTVTQNAITQNEYEFWQQIKKTTESLGGLFDPIPGTVLGNIHNDNDEQDPVLGYFSGGFVQEKVKYLRFLDMPGDLRVVDPLDFDCGERLLFLSQLTDIKPEEVYLQQVGTPVYGYAVANEKCGDCQSLFGGTNVKPDDWPIF
jgi:hypothetical protein